MTTTKVAAPAAPSMHRKTKKNFGPSTALSAAAIVIFAQHARMPSDPSPECRTRTIRTARAPPSHALEKVNNKSHSEYGIMAIATGSTVRVRVPTCSRVGHRNSRSNNEHLIGSGLNLRMQISELMGAGIVWVRPISCPMTRAGYIAMHMPGYSLSVPEGGHAIRLVGAHLGPCEGARQESPGPCA